MVSPEKFKLTGEFPRKLVVALDRRAVELGVSRNAMMIILLTEAMAKEPK